MRPLLALFVAFCLVSVAITKPLPEGDEEAANVTEEPKKEEDQPTEKPADDADAGAEKEEGDEKKTEDEDKSKDAGEEKTEDGGNDATKDKEEEGEGGDEEDSPKSKGGKGKGKNDPVETYNKVIELLDKTTKIDKVDSSHLRAGLVNDLQTYLRNPIVDVIGTVGDYSKISSCFKSMDNDVKKILEEVMKSFKSCKDKKDSNEHQCSSDRSTAQGKIAKIATAVSSCVSSKRS
ncbi:30 kDa salivary gland allergen Aed a 3-like [Ochlerotatus camptorhynchus]|uniref:30 kDa salivary gland allergen Aed a 3-like n=1 Tax=Ochlerotatus camptorhynchus TaxID=644619 RepID=UPI0031D992BF